MDVTNQSDTLAAYSAVAVNDKPVALTGQAAIIDRFLTANNLSATTTADGLNYVISFQGTGTLPAKGHTVTMNYSGYILNSKGTEGTEGTEFDSTINSKLGHVSPFSFTLGAGQVIAGWDEAFALLPVGTTAEIILPSALA